HREAAQGSERGGAAEANLAKGEGGGARWASQYSKRTTPAAFELMVRTSPERHQQFLEARQQRDAAAQRLNELRVIRTAAQQNVAAIRQQQVDAWAKSQDSEFWNVLQQKYPALAKDTAKLHRATS